MYGNALYHINSFYAFMSVGGLAVHMVGGLTGVIGAIIVGPRTGRFTMNDKNQWIDTNETGHSAVISLVNRFQFICFCCHLLLTFCTVRLVIIQIGTFLLWFGWFGFNW